MDERTGYCNGWLILNFDAIAYCLVLWKKKESSRYKNLDIFITSPQSIDIYWAFTKLKKITDPVIKKKTTGLFKQTMLGV